MSDLISRADAIAYIDRIINSGLGRNKSLDYIHKYISLLPSADRPQGEWIHDTHYGANLPEHRCSICGVWEYSDEESNYCSNCGAYMGGDDE